MALRTEKLSDAPWLGRVTKVSDSSVELVWLEGGYTRSWKPAKIRRGRSLVEWKDKVTPNTIMMYGFELTPTNRLKRSTIIELKTLYAEYCTS